MPGLPKQEKARAINRRRVLKAGVIAYNGRHVTLECGIRDMSETGAKLNVSGSIAAPDTFELLIELDAISVPCEVVWRRGAEVGVRFTAPVQPYAKKRQQVVDQWAKTAAKPTLRRQPKVTA